MPPIAIVLIVIHAIVKERALPHEVVVGSLFSGQGGITLGCTAMSPLSLDSKEPKAPFGSPEFGSDVVRNGARF